MAISTELPSHVSTPETRHHVSKVWGWEDWLWNDENYCGKRLFLKSGHRCSWHYHVIKDEVLYVQSGMIIMRYSQQDDPALASEIILREGMAFHVEPGMRHQMSAVVDTMIFEVSTHHEDLDSIRLGVGGAN